ncbi:hypothetical protein MY1884_003109 [Beauveria asiatica]
MAKQKKVDNNDEEGDGDDSASPAPSNILRLCLDKRLTSSSLTLDVCNAPVSWQLLIINFLAACHWLHSSQPKEANGHNLTDSENARQSPVIPPSTTLARLSPLAWPVPPCLLNY